MPTEQTVVALPDPRLLVVTEPTVVALPDPRLLAGSDPDHHYTEPAPRAEQTVMANPRRRPKPRLDSDAEAGAKTEPFSMLTEPMLGLAAPRRARGSGKGRGARRSSEVQGTVSLGKYQLLRPLASGATSHVFLARHDSEGGSARHLAVKTLRRQHVYDTGHVAAFHDEASLLGGMHHRSLAQVFEVALSSDGTHYLAMEYLHGETLAAMLQQARATKVGLPLDFALTAVTAAASALEHVHERHGADPRWLKLPHREISPASLTAVYDGLVKITSFGASKAGVRAGLAGGEAGKARLGYLTPEHVLNRPLDPRSDVFTLGMVLYELTTLVNPFAARSMQELKARVVRGEPTPPTQVVPGYPLELEQIVLTALNKAPDHRFQSCAALSNALIELGNSLGLVIGPNAIRQALAQLFGGKVEPWLESAETPMPGMPDMRGMHDRGDAAAPIPAQPSAHPALQMTQPQPVQAAPQWPHRSAPTGPVSVHVVPRASAAMTTQMAPQSSQAMSVPPQVAPMPMTTLPMAAVAAPLPVVSRAMTPGQPPRLPAVSRAMTPGQPPPLPVVSRVMTPGQPPPLPVVSRAMTPGQPPPLPVVSRAMTPGQPPAVSRAMTPGQPPAVSRAMTPSAPPAVPTAPLAVPPSTRAAMPAGPPPLPPPIPSAAAAPSMPTPRAPSTRAPLSVPLPPRSKAPTGVPMPTPRSKAPSGGSDAPMTTAPSTRTKASSGSPITPVGAARVKAPSGPPPPPPRSKAPSEAPIAPMSNLTSAPHVRAAAVMAPFPAPRPQASTQPPPLPAALAIPAPALAAAPPPMMSEQAPPLPEAAPSSMPTLRGHEGSKARVAVRARSSELISTDELHRIVDHAHASAWKESPSRATPMPLHPAGIPPGAAATPQPQRAAAPARPAVMLEARVSTRPRRHAAHGSGPESTVPWSGLAAPVPSAVALSQPLTSAIAPPLQAEEPSGSSALRRICETILVIFTLALLALGRPELAPVWNSLGLDLSLEIYTGTSTAPATPATSATTSGAVTTTPTTENGSSASPSTTTGTPTTTTTATPPATTPTTTATPPVATPTTTATPPVTTPTTMFKLTIVTQPPDATVILDGERLGRTPLTIERPAGDGTAVLRLRHRGYQARRIEIKRNQNLSLEIKLRPAPEEGAIDGDTGTSAVEPATLPQIP